MLKHRKLRSDRPHIQERTQHFKKATTSKTKRKEEGCAIVALTCASLTSSICDFIHSSYESSSCEMMDCTAGPWCGQMAVTCNGARLLLDEAPSPCCWFFEPLTLSNPNSFWMNTKSFLIMSAPLFGTNILYNLAGAKLRLFSISSTCKIKKKRSIAFSWRTPSFFPRSFFFWLAAP